MKPAFTMLAAFAVASCAVTGTDPYEPPDLPGGPAPDSSTCAANIEVVGPMRTKLDCEAYCLPDTAPRSSIMRVTWLDDARGRPGDSRVDMTIYKTGFDELAYASYCDVPEEQKAAAGPNTPVVHLAAIEDEPSLQAHVVERREARRRGERNELIVRDLQPGVTYFWRAAQLTSNGWLASDVTMCLSAVCPVDYVDEAIPKRPPKKPSDKYPVDQRSESRDPADPSFPKSAKQQH